MRISLRYRDIDFLAEAQQSSSESDDPLIRRPDSQNANAVGAELELVFRLLLRFIIVFHFLTSSRRSSEASFWLGAVVIVRWYDIVSVRSCNFVIHR